MTGTEGSRAVVGSATSRSGTSGSSTPVRPHLPPKARARGSRKAPLGWLPWAALALALLLLAGLVMWALAARDTSSAARRSLSTSQPAQQRAYVRTSLVRPPR